MSEIIIRHSEVTDALAIKRIYQEHTGYGNTLQLPFPSQGMWLSRLENPPAGMQSLVVECDGEVVGQLGLMPDQHPRRRHVGTFGMGVREDYQGRGIGSKLMQAALDLADNWLNLIRLELEVFTENTPAIALYKKYGFHIEGESAAYAFRNGEYANVYHMARLNRKQE